MIRPSLRPIATLGLAVLVLSWSTTLGLARQASGTGTSTQAAKPAAPPQSGAGVQAAPGQGRSTPPSNGQFQGGRGPGGSPGRDDGPKWWQDEAIKKEISLTPNQIQQIDGIYQRRVKDMAPFADELEKQNDLFMTMLRERTADFSAVQLQINKVESLRMKLSESRWMMVYRMYKVLDATQYAKLQAYAEKQRAEWSRGRGRGGL